MNKRTKNQPDQPSCPICNEPCKQQYRPFCSKRCADIDLNRWLTGQYAIPVEEEEPDDEALQMANLGDGPKLN